MYIENPKTAGSGVLACIPQKGECPNKCADCFFQSGRSYLEPLEENLPNIPDPLVAFGRVVRMNDGNDSNVNRRQVEDVAKRFLNVFFNTTSPERLEEYPGPVVLTVNPGEMTDEDFHKLDPIPVNLMYVRVRVNAWNCDVVREVVIYYTQRVVPVVLTFMAYYETPLPVKYAGHYEYTKRTLNDYWVLKDWARENIEKLYQRNPNVYSCGYKGTHSCKQCGNCLREYFATKERIEKGANG